MKSVTQATEKILLKGGGVGGEIIVTTPSTPSLDLPLSWFSQSAQ